MVKLPQGTSLSPLLISLGISSFASMYVYVLRNLVTASVRYEFLLWNLVLAWVPLGIAWWLVHMLRRRSWVSWQTLILTALWLGFLPNSFYIASDLIHLHATGEVSLLYDTVLFLGFIWNGFAVGFLSLYLVHRQLYVRLPVAAAHSLIAAILLACSFAIYLGRNLRWNSWDIFTSPAGLLFDISDRVVNPAAHPQTFVTTSIFFVLLGSIYIVLWQVGRLSTPSSKE